MVFFQIFRKQIYGIPKLGKNVRIVRDVVAGKFVKKEYRQTRYSELC